jgi:putative CocE/NonD family hydrolase
MRDGTKLALDIFRPARNGAAVSDPLPVIWTYDRYHRATVQNGRLVTQLDGDQWLMKVLRHGYVIGVADARGAGASFGNWQGPSTDQEARDGYDVTEWFAAQPWCNKRVGMYGRSYLGISQYVTAATSPPHLKAIFPEMAMFDLYSFAYAGGVFRNDFAANWNRLISDLDTVTLAAPVDEDKNGALLRKSVEDHMSNRNVYEMMAALPLRDSFDERSKSKPYFTQSPSRALKEINKSGVAVYHLTGWNDLWAKDAILWFSNLSVPQKLTIGPWSHGASFGIDLAEEHLRWYDFWLKDIDNGVMRESAIQYYTMGAPAGHEWRSTSQWPLPQQQIVNYYFHGELAGSHRSPRDYSLSVERPQDASGVDEYVVDYSTTTGKGSRWANGYGRAFGYGDLTPNDEKGLTYTTPPIVSPIEVTGHPVAHVWVASKAKDLDVFVYLEEIDRSGISQYVTEGNLRASHRALGKPADNLLNLPYHRSFAEDIKPLTDEPVELVFDLFPTSNVFDAGNRIRITITGADKDNFETPELQPPPVLGILRNSNHASYVSLPVIPTAQALALTPSLTATQTSGAPNRDSYFVRPFHLWLAGGALALGLVLLMLFIRRSYQ